MHFRPVYSSFENVVLVERILYSVSVFIITFARILLRSLKINAEFSETEMSRRGHIYDKCRYMQVARGN